MNRDPGFLEVSGKFRVRLKGFWVFLGVLVVTSAFAEVELVYELSAKTLGAFRDVVFYSGARSVKDP